MANLLFRKGQATELMNKITSSWCAIKFAAEKLLFGSLKKSKLML